MPPRCLTKASLEVVVAKGTSHCQETLYKACSMHSAVALGQCVVSFSSNVGPLCLAVTLLLPTPNIFYPVSVYW